MGKIVYCLVYVLPLHLLAATRASPARSRDDPKTIQARIRSVSLSTAACSLATLAILSGTLKFPGGPTSDPSHPLQRHASALHLMGYWPIGLVETLKALSLTALLFAAPLYECLIVDGVWVHWLRLEPVRRVWTDWPAWRNMVAVRRHIEET